ncbi:YjeF N-terminal domain [Pseudocohnilembus persalinus]|uniref:NAD(P)H-hydrate epimerase n=1 Tax=Pseudocohnilembus persalinus TaxID=266149 RepID=A0A0V0R1D2_PSEPJ|nr:YjeF N-terminal domain [Pseudocohnilembus persalinus]|eukprot:KRX08343.1 YjeF N-terminal domain [Pseudocohnilembus persalinus]
MAQSNQINYLDQKTAQNTDLELMNELGFSIDVLMELAGQSIAHSLFDANKNFHQNKINKYIFLAGVGNNGGDAIVAARHMKMLGKDCEVMIFREPNKDLIINLIKTCQANKIKVSKFQDLLDENDSQKTQENLKNYFQNYDIIVDGIFGFSFKPPVRKPYDQILDYLKNSNNKPVFSIDIPSGWDVEQGNVDEQYFTPEYLISLTLPKLVAKKYQGKHYLGGRFIPQCMIEKYNWKVPEYPEDKTFVLLQ